MLGLALSSENGSSCGLEWADGDVAIEGKNAPPAETGNLPCSEKPGGNAVSECQGLRPQGLTEAAFGDTAGRDTEPLERDRDG